MYLTYSALQGGVFEMVQLWVNLPAANKMDPPKYQPILSSEIPVVPLPDGAGKVNVIAGDFQGTAGRASTHTPVNMWDVTLKAGRSLLATIPEGHNTIVFVRSGSVTTAGIGKDGQPSAASIVQGQISIFSQDGHSISLEAGPEDAQVVVLSGEPINEPIAARGPFVMNTQDELYQAMDDFSKGKMGKHF